MSTPSPAPDLENSSALLEQQLRAAIRGEVHFDPVIRGIHATDASHYQVMPTCVVVPRDEADCIAAIKIAHQHQLSITARGGATSLSGQTFGQGLILDLSKYMDQILEVNEDEQWMRVQPGAVRDRINQQLKPTGLHFTPDPATGNRATLGGMLGNNTSGTRSVVYGKTIDQVIACRVALADGTILDCHATSEEEWQRKAQGNDVEARIYQGVKQIIDQYQDEILARYPKVMRRVSGYNLDEFVDGAGYTGAIGPRREHNQGHRVWNLANLIVGSEGTLGVLLEATVRLIPLPKATAVCVVHFDDLYAALNSVDVMLEHQPSTVELLDDVVMNEAKINAATRQLAHFIDGSPQAVLIVEFMGDTPQQAQQKIDAFIQDMQSRDIGYAWPSFADAKGQADILNTRKLGLGLITNVKGVIKGRDFIEDACVPTDKLASYVKKIMDLCQSMGIDRVSKYAHASVGVLHIAPALDLHKPEDVEKMATIAKQAFTWVMEYGGSWSGEHGDGQLRGQFLPQMFGDSLYEAFRQVKATFDPDNLMNRGKVVDAPLMTDHLRYQQPGYTEHADHVQGHYHHRDQGGFALAVEQCNGVGACRKVGEGTMCPSYMATRNESDTTRGRANAIRLAMSGQLGEDALASEELQHAVMDLCLACKACKTECPNAVDMAKLKSDTLQMRHDKHGVPLGYKLIGDMPTQAKRLAGPLAYVVNAVMKLPGYRLLMEKVGGFDRRRPIPGFATKPLKTRLKNRPAPTSTPRGKVVLFDDTYANYMEPSVGVAAVNLLEGCGYEVIIANAGCCQRTRMSKGLVRDAKRDGAKTMQKLDAFAQQGLTIVCLEPSCASSLVDDLPDLIDDAQMGQRVAQQVRMIDVFLEEQGVELESDHPQILLHGHCHQKSLFGTGSMERAFEQMEHVSCAEAGAGCCGMAGSFGYEHYDVSQKVGEDRLFPAVREAIKQGKTIVAPGISCRHQLHDSLDVQAKHWVQVVRPKNPVTS